VGLRLLRARDELMEALIEFRNAIIKASEAGFITALCDNEPVNIDGMIVILNSLIDTFDLLMDENEMRSQ
jgi:hypothetical protein